MKIAISDFHIGSPLFKMQDHIIELFNRPEVEEVYILGDIIDTWEGDVDKIVEDNKEFITFLNECNKVKVMLRGNHDPDMETFKKIFYNLPVLEKYETEVMGKRIVMVHGNEFDSTLSWMDDLFIIHYYLQRVGINIKLLSVRASHWICRKLQGLGKSDLVFESEKELFENYTKDYDIVIAGHTHIPKLYKNEKGTYMNCGCIISRPSYIEIDSGVARKKRFK